MLRKSPLALIMACWVIAFAASRAPGWWGTAIALFGMMPVGWWATEFQHRSTTTKPEQP